MYSFLFDIDDTVYDQLSPFREAFAKQFARFAHIPLEELYRHSRKFSDEVFEQTERGEMSREEMHIYRITAAFKMFDIEISASAARQFQLDYEAQQQRICLLPEIADVLHYCKSQGFHTRYHYERPQRASACQNSATPPKPLDFSGACPDFRCTGNRKTRQTNLCPCARAHRP